jgi:hypothetical protein
VATDDGDAGGGRLMSRRWVFVGIAVALIVAGLVSWISTGSTRNTSAASGSSSASSDGAGPACTLAEMANTSTDKEIFQGIAPVGRSVVAAGTRYTASIESALAAFGTREGWTSGLITPFGEQSSLDGVSDDRAGGAWAVGVTGRIPAIARWNGRSWAAVSSNDPNVSLDVLSGVAAVSPRSAWAVGRHDDDGTYRTLVERWDGSAWHVVPSPNVGSGPNTLRSVAVVGPDDVWAVGWALSGGHYRALAQHWDGSGWNVVATPPAGRGDAVLTGVAASGHDVWSVGWVGDADAQRPVIQRWDGSRWANVPTPPELGPAAFSAVAPTAHGIAVVGRQIVDARPQALALLYDADGWHPVALDTTPSAQAWLSGVTLDASGRVWAVGTRLAPDGLFASLVVTGCDGR